MIRPVQPDDTLAIMGLAVSSGLFSEAEADGVRTLMDDFFARTREQGHDCLLDAADDDDVPVGVAYYQPTPATDRTWTLLMIAVRRDRQGRGRGGALLSRVDELRRRQQRLLLVETSGSPGFAPARAFYDKSGYFAEARVRDYYEVGDDMVIYRKDLMAEPTDPTRGIAAAATDAPGGHAEKS